MCVISWNSLGLRISQFKSFSNHEILFLIRSKGQSLFSTKYSHKKHTVLKNKSLHFTKIRQILVIFG